MTEPERQAILEICFHAALADGRKSAAEHAALERAAQRLGLVLPADLNSAGDLYARSQAVAAVAGRVGDRASARLAFELAVAICEADEAPNPAERWFLEELRRALGLEAAAAAETVRRAEELTSAAVPVPMASPTSSAERDPLGVNAAELDQLIQNRAILAGALELLPDTLATMAIVPVQMQLVYQIGKAHGYELDRGHIRDLLATVGVGLASQVVESYAERAVRGLLGKFAGGWVTGMAGQLTSSGLSFATTYALGQLARQYYAGGRTLDAIQLRSLYGKLLGQGRSLEPGLASRIREQAGQVNLGRLTSLLKL